jgi:hypothetical protein
VGSLCGVLPVYELGGWQVERVMLDRGDGLRAWWEIRHDGTSEYCRDRTAVRVMLAGHGLEFGRFGAVDTIDDGCE